MKWRVLVLACAAVLVAASCGSRTDDEASEPDTGTDGDSGTAEVVDTPEVDAPCGEGEASGATDVGVTDDAITIATIQDIDVPGVQGLFQQNLEAMQAFVEWCNNLGGVEGRELVLEEYDSRLTSHLPAVEAACQSSFAIVGMASVFDAAGMPAARECGIPIVAGITGSPEASEDTEVLVQPIPNPTSTWSTGPGRYVLEQAPGVAERAAMYAAPSSARQQADQQVEAYEAIGFDFVIDEEIGIGEQRTAWSPRIEHMRDLDIGFVYVQAEDSDLANFVTEAEAQGLDVEWVDAGQQVYNPGFLEQAGAAAEGVHIYATTVPFEEADTSPMLQTYLEWLEQTNAGAIPDALGVQSWSAGLLFATAAAELGSDLTRTGLLDELRSIDEWDGLGMHVPTNPAGNRGAECFLYLRVEDGEFVRDFPEEGFSCDPENLQQIGG